MKPLPRRPTVQLLAPPVVAPGVPFPIRVVLTCRRPLDVIGVWATVKGEARFGLSPGGQAHTLFHHTLPLGPAATLPAGPTVLETLATVPRDAPPTFRGRLASFLYTVDVLVRVPRWLDRRATFELGVGTRDDPRSPGPTAVWSSDPDGPTHDEPHAELSLGATVLAPGNVLSGAVALANVKRNRYTHLEVSLVGREYLAHEEVEVRRAARRLRLHHLTEDAAEAFTFTLPSGLPPTFAFGDWRLGWTVDLRASVQGHRAIVVSVPVTMAPTFAGGPIRFDPQPVGGERVARLWKRVGTSLGLRFRDGILSGRLQGTEISIRSELRGERGLFEARFLVARLTYPPLRLGLHVTRGHRGRLRLAARDAAQGAAFQAELQRRGGTEALDTLTDEAALLTMRDAGRREGVLRAFCSSALATARAIAWAYEVVPPPAACAADVAAWRRVAARLGATFRIADMSFSAMRAGIPIEVETLWDERGQPTGTRLVLRPPWPLRAGEPAPRSTAESVRVEGEALVFERAGRLAEPAQLPDDVARLVQLADRFRVGGPYR